MKIAAQRSGGSGAAPHLALIAVQIMFGTWPIFGKIALRSISSTGLVAFRTGGAALLFLLLQRTTSSVKITRRKDYARIALYSLLGVVLNQLLFVKGLALTTVANATLLGSTIPIFALVISIALGYDRLTFKKILGVLLAAAGVIYLINPLQADFSGQTMLGNLLLLCNACSYAAYIAISKEMLKRYGALTVITWIFLFGSLVTVPLGIYYTDDVALSHAGIRVWLAIVYIIIVPTVGAYYLNAWALARVAPSAVAIYIYLQPLVAFSLTPLILGEQVNPRMWVAMLLIFAGVFAATLRERSYAIEEVSEHPDAMSH